MPTGRIRNSPAMTGPITKRYTQPIPVTYSGQRDHAHARGPTCGLPRRGTLSHNCLAIQEKSHLVQPPPIILEVLGVLAVDGFQLPPRGPLREERVDEEAAEHIQGSVEVPGVYVEEVVRVLNCVHENESTKTQRKHVAATRKKATAEAGNGFRRHILLKDTRNTS